MTRWVCLAVVVTSGCADPDAAGGSTFPTVDQECLSVAHERYAAGETAVGDRPPRAPGGDAKPEPQHVDAKLVEGHRIAGEKAIHPDTDTMYAMSKAHVSSTAPAVEICLGTDGVPTEITILRSSCFPRYDAHIKNKMSEWRYSQYLVDGQPAPVCTAVVFTYHLK
jgi:hypothetical protein